MNSPELRRQIIPLVANRFRCFGQGSRPSEGNPIAHAFKDKPPMFAAGVDVEQVVDFILSVAENLARKTK